MNDQTEPVLEERPRLARDHAEECFEQYRLSFLVRASARARKRGKFHLGTFCGVGLSAVNSWCRRDFFPRGEQRIKLTCYLDSVGFRVIELEKMTETMRALYEMIGHGIFASPDVQALLGYQSTTSMFEFLNGKMGISQERQEKLWEVIRPHLENLVVKKKKSQLEVAKVLLDFAKKHRKEKSPQVPIDVVIKKKPEALTKIMEGLLALLGEDALSNDERSVLRGSKGLMYDLSERLRALSLESTPQHIISTRCSDG